jgi:hypothetical protein
MFPSCHEDQCEWKLIDDDGNVPSPISPNIQHSDFLELKIVQLPRYLKKKKKLNKI